MARWGPRNYTKIYERARNLDGGAGNFPLGGRGGRKKGRWEARGRPGGGRGVLESFVSFRTFFCVFRGFPHNHKKKRRPKRDGAAQGRKAMAKS